MNPSDVVFKPVRELSELVRTRQVSPIELTEIFLERLETIGPTYNAVVTLTPERAMEQARRAESELASGNYRGPLHGIPYGLKDLFATADIPASWGATPFRGQTFDRDATVARKLEDAGAILVAKLAMVELAGGVRYKQPNATFSGPGINPWGDTTWAGGSSSGSGSAVSAGLVPFAIGTETWGSIIMPSANCGIAGLRPTYGRVSRHGGMPLSWTLDKPGPMCQTADDCGLVLNAIAGQDAKDLTTFDEPFLYESTDGGRRFKLAIPKGATDDIEDSVRENFESALTILKKIADIEEVELPDYPYGAVITAIFMGESTTIFSEFAKSGRSSELTAPEDRYGIYARSTMLASDYLRAMRIRKMIARDIDDLMSRYDAIVAPSRPTVATPLDVDRVKSFKERSQDIIGAMGNCIGLPAITVPSGFSDEDLPTGIQFLGRAYDENVILSIANAYQSMTAWHERHPVDVISES
jgi:aspartyl-tRNA(Asn)/glutamyl-tRNA(Gln) amidotransferase subunit A